MHFMFLEVCGCCLPSCSFVSFVVTLFSFGYHDLDALHAPLHVECYTRTPRDAVAQSLLVMENRDLLRGQNAADRFPGILGVLVARTYKPMAIPEMDG
jgi:hypothetical protein